MIYSDQKHPKNKSSHYNGGAVTRCHRPHCRYLVVALLSLIIQSKITFRVLAARVYVDGNGILIRTPGALYLMMNSTFSVTPTVDDHDALAKRCRHRPAFDSSCCNPRCQNTYHQQWCTCGHFDSFHDCWK